MTDIGSLEERNKILVVRQRMAQVWNSLMVRAHSAALSYSINYMDLPEYQDRTLIEGAEKLVIEQQEVAYTEYCRRVEHAIHAAIQRKTLKKIDAFSSPAQAQAREIEADLEESAERATIATERRKGFRLV